MQENPGSIKTAVIIGSGTSSQKEGEGISSGKIGGLTVFERIVFTCFKAGIEKFVVLGFNEEEVIGIRKRQKKGLQMELIQSIHPHPLSNESLEAVKNSLNAEQRFFLISDECVFDPSALQELEEGASLLDRFKVVAATVNNHGHEADDSPLRLESDGDDHATLAPGLFLANEATLVWMSSLLSQEDSALFEVLNRAGKAGEMGLRELKDSFLRYVGTERNVKIVEKEVFRRLAKTTDGFLASNINRKISISMSKVFAKTDITPNILTLLTLAVGLTAGYCFSMGGYMPMLAGSLIFQFSSIMDGCDGEIARLKFIESRFGGWLDIICDNLTHLAVFGGIAMGAYQMEPASHWIYFGWLAILGTSMSFLIVAYQLYQKESGTGPFFTSVAEEKKNAGGHVESVVNLQDQLARRDFTYLVILFAVFGYVQYFLVLTAIGSNVFWLLLLYSKLK